jgi:hypothetical protein
MNPPSGGEVRNLLLIETETIHEANGNIISPKDSLSV